MTIKEIKELLQDPNLNPETLEQLRSDERKRSAKITRFL